MYGEVQYYSDLSEIFIIYLPSNWYQNFYDFGKESSSFRYRRAPLAKLCRQSGKQYKLAKLQAVVNKIRLFGEKFQERSKKKSKFKEVQANMI